VLNRDRCIDSALVRRVLPLTILPIVLLAAGCGSGQAVKPLPDTVVGTVPTQATAAIAAIYKHGDPVAGKQVFASAGCGGCHTLKDAGTSGTVGPNLDQAQPPLSKVVTQVINGGGAMPPFKGTLSAKQIADVAAYVVKATGGNPNG
jgi:mono/diheme cytochrome c family protein